MHTVLVMPRLPLQQTDDAATRTSRHSPPEAVPQGSTDLRTPSPTHLQVARPTPQSASQIAHAARATDTLEAVPNSTALSSAACRRHLQRQHMKLVERSRLRRSHRLSGWSVFTATCIVQGISTIAVRPSTHRGESAMSGVEERPRQLSLPAGPWRQFEEHGS
jgi:hypothetical protein